MIPIDPLWVYIAVPVVIVSTLILIKLRQMKLDKIVTGELSSAKREVPAREDEAAKGILTEAEETQTTLEPREKTKPQGCLNYLGYLYMRKFPDRTHIPTECYNCSLLLKCLYSPVVVEKVYGE